MGWNDHDDAVDSAKASLKSTSEYLHKISAQRKPISEAGLFAGYRRYLQAAQRTGPSSDSLDPEFREILLHEILRIPAVWEWRTNVRCTTNSRLGIRKQPQTSKPSRREAE